MCTPSGARVGIGAGAFELLLATENHFQSQSSHQKRNGAYCYYKNNE